jgi:hypothetical protein
LKIDGSTLDQWFVCINSVVVVTGTPEGETWRSLGSEKLYPIHSNTQITTEISARPEPSSISALYDETPEDGA